MIKIRILLALALIGLAGCGTFPPGESYPYQGPITTNGVPVVEPSFGAVIRDGHKYSREWGICIDKCAWCPATEDIQVHHIEPQHITPDRKHDKSNMIPFCRECHFCIGHRHDWNSDGVTNVLRMIEEGNR